MFCVAAQAAEKDERWIAGDRNAMTEVADMVDALANDQLVLVLGPEFVLDRDGRSAHQSFTDKFVRNNEALIESYDPASNLLKPATRSAQLTIQQAYAGFYEIEYPLMAEDMYEPLVQIPFSLILSLNPDSILKNLYARRRLASSFDYFSLGKKFPADFPPTKDLPCLFNLFGCHEQPESMVLTYHDLFEYLREILASDGLPMHIRAALSDARNIVFIGMPFDNWYIQLLTNMLLQYRDAGQCPRYSVSDASHPGQDGVLCRDDFTVQVIRSNVAGFIDELYYECGTRNLLRGGAAAAAEKTVRREYYLSYASTDESLKVLDSVTRTLVEKKCTIRHLGNGSVEHATRRNGWDKYAVLVVSDTYLKSPYCMRELLEIRKNSDFRGRILPILTNDVKIFPANEQLAYAEFWEREIGTLNIELGRLRSAPELHDLIETLKLYHEIRIALPDIMRLLRAALPGANETP